MRESPSLKLDWFGEIKSFSMKYYIHSIFSRYLAGAVVGAYLAKLIAEEELNPLNIKGALYGLRHFLASESPLKKMKNVFYFTLKALFVLKIFKFLS